MKFKTSLLTVLLTSILISCNEKKSDSLEVTSSENEEVIDKVEDNSSKSKSNSSMHFTIDSNKYIFDKDNSSGSNVLESNGLFSLVISFLDSNDKNTWGSIIVKFEGDTFNQGVKNVKNAVLTINYSEEGSLPMAYSSEKDKFKLTISKVDIAKSESAAGVTITDYKFSGIFSGYMEGVDANGSIKSVEVKDGKFENFSFAQIKKN